MGNIYDFDEMDNNMTIEQLNMAHSIMKKLKKKKEENDFNNLPDSKMKIYAYLGSFDDIFFDTEEELDNWILNYKTDFGCSCIIDYLGTVAGKNDVIKITYSSNEYELNSVCDENGYDMYSPNKKEKTWEYNYGSLEKIYNAFRKRGIIFTDDVYQKIQNQKIYEYFKELNI